MKAVIFDLDGTILYTLPDLNNALNYTLPIYNHNKISIEDTRKLIGHGIRNLILDSSGHDNININNMYNTFMEYYHQHCDDNTIPYEGIKELLSYLKSKDYILGVITNKNIIMTEKLLNNHFNNIFDVVIGDGVGFKRKPDIESLEYIRTKFNVLKDDIIYIGDSEVDFEFSKNFGCKNIIVSYGYRDKKDLEAYGINNIIDNVSLLKNEINNIFKS
jgi:phosphoglycolate phosphatase